MGVVGRGAQVSHLMRNSTFASRYPWKKPTGLDPLCHLPSGASMTFSQASRCSDAAAHAGGRVQVAKVQPPFSEGLVFSLLSANWTLT